MREIQVDVYRHLRSGDVDAYESSPVITNLTVRIEPAGTVLVAPIDTAIGQVFNIWIDTYISLDLAEGYKLVNTADASEYYIIRGGVQEYRRGDSRHYEFVVERPV